MMEVGRVPHPVTSYQQAQLNRREICEPRGYCGPFINCEVYDTFPDPVWHGCAECVHCCGTRNVAEEEAKQQLSLRVTPEAAPIPCLPPQL